MKRENTYISASEIGDFVYCKREWWLKMRGLLPVTYQMEQGTVQHAQLATKVLSHPRLVIMAIIIIALGIILFIVALFLGGGS